MSWIDEVEIDKLCTIANNLPNNKTIYFLLEFNEITALF